MNDVLKTSARQLIQQSGVEVEFHKTLAHRARQQSKYCCLSWGQGETPWPTPLWTTLGRMVKCSGLGDEPRRVLNELSKISLVDVVLPTSAGVEIRKRCITRPTELLR